MADAILYGVARTIIERLGSSTFQEIGSIWGMKDELEKMSNTVSAIQAVLEDAEEMQVNNRQVRDWLMKLRDAVFDADDLLSEFSTHVLRQSVMGGTKMTRKGFIQSPEENLQLEDAANEYFMDLIWRSFFQEAEEDEGMNMKFKMHDLIHDLAQLVSRIECALVDSNAKNVNEKVRHLSFPYYKVSFFAENLSTLIKANKIRTFILAYHNWNYDKGIKEESTLKTLISNFRYLRALDLYGLKLKTLPNIIGNLMYLKYLDFSFNDLEVLPGFITKLVNLQTLKLSMCENLRELPIDIKKLVSLKHLDISGCENLTHMPSGLGQLTSLQT